VSSRTRVCGAIVAALIVAGVSGGPRAASVIAPTFDAMVARAQLVFVGETLDVRSRWESTPSGRAIVSVVTFKVIRTLKGELGGQTQLEFLGGTVGDYRMEIPGMPRFRVGDEDVLFVDERGQPVSPVVGFMHGRFRVLEDPATRRRSVARHNFEPLASVRDIGAATAPARKRLGPEAGHAQAELLHDRARLLRQERHVQEDRELVAGELVERGVPDLRGTARGAPSALPFSLRRARHSPGP